MGWQKGLKRKKVEELRANDLIEDGSTVTVTQPFSLVLGIRHWGASSKFPNLWQLVTIERDGTEREIIDATSRASVINMAHLAIGKCL